MPRNLFRRWAALHAAGSHDQPDGFQQGADAPPFILRQTHVEIVFCFHDEERDVVTVNVQTGCGIDIQ
jgi:hypothetical protein